MSAQPVSGGIGGGIAGFLRSWMGAIVLGFILLVWTVPSIGLLVSSFRPESEVRNTGWWQAFTNPDVTLENYRTVLGSSGGQAGDMWQHFLNSLTIAVPATVIPIAIAAFAAYAFAWMDFRGREWLFVAVVGLLVVPLHVALVPLLRVFTTLDINGTFLSVWIAHIGFGLPLATYLLYVYIAGLPKDLFEAARIDGADHFKIFTKIVLPLSTPALAAFGIFQFLWVWNDFLVAVVFVGSAPDAAPMTVRLAELVGSRGEDQHILTAGAFVTMIVPLIVFFSLQRYFVRGLTAGSVKG